MSNMVNEWMHIINNNNPYIYGHLYIFYRVLFIFIFLTGILLNSPALKPAELISKQFYNSKQTTQQWLTKTLLKKPSLLDTLDHFLFFPLCSFFIFSIFIFAEPEGTCTKYCNSVVLKYTDLCIPDSYWPYTGVFFFYQ